MVLNSFNPFLAYILAHEIECRIKKEGFSLNMPYGKKDRTPGMSQEMRLCELCSDHNKHDHLFQSKVWSSSN